MRRLFAVNDIVRIIDYQNGATVGMKPHLGDICTVIQSHNGENTFWYTLRSVTTGDIIEYSWDEQWLQSWLEEAVNIITFEDKDFFI